MFIFLPVRKFFTQAILSHRKWPLLTRRIKVCMITIRYSYAKGFSKKRGDAAIASIVTAVSERLLEELPQIRRCPPPHVSTVSDRTGFGRERSEVMRNSCRIRTVGLTVGSF